MVRRIGLGTIANLLIILIVIVTTFAIGTDETPVYQPKETLDDNLDIGEALIGCPKIPAAGQSATFDFIARSGNYDVGFASSLPYSGWNASVWQFRGLTHDLMDQLKECVGGAPYGIPMQWDKVVPRLVKEANLKVVLDGPEPESEHDSGLRFVPIWERSYCLVARTDDSRFLAADDIAKPGVVFSVVEGTELEVILRKQYPELELRTQKAHFAEEALAEVLSGQADVSYIDALVAEVLVEEVPDLKYFPQDCTSKDLFPTMWGVVVRKDDATWEQFIVDWIDELKKIGWFEQHLAQHLQPEKLKPLIANAIQEAAGAK